MFQRLGVRAKLPGAVVALLHRHGSKLRADEWAGVPPASALETALPAGAGGVPTFLAPFDSEFVHFFKNIGMAGGLVVFLAYSSDGVCNEWM